MNETGKEFIGCFPELFRGKSQSCLISEPAQGEKRLTMQACVEVARMASFSPLPSCHNALRLTHN
jgi:hypothetical protein